MGIGIGIKPDLSNPLKSVFLDTSGVNDGRRGNRVRHRRRDRQRLHRQRHARLPGDALRGGRRDRRLRPASASTSPTADGDCALDLRRDARPRARRRRPSAQAMIKASRSTPSPGEFLPSVRPSSHYSQLLGDIELSTAGGLKIDIGSPDVIAARTSRSTSAPCSTASSGDTLSTIYDIVSPFKPVVDLLHDGDRPRHHQVPVHRHRLPAPAGEDRRHREEGAQGHPEHHRVPRDGEGPGRLRRHHQLRHLQPDRGFARGPERRDDRRGRDAAPSAQRPSARRHDRSRRRKLASHARARTRRA